jgi:hypothetical protein
MEGADERLLNAGLPPALHSEPGNLLHVALSSSVSIEEAATTVPGLKFPRRQPWQKTPVLELNLGEVPTAGMRLHIPLHGCTHTHQISLSWSAEVQRCLKGVQAAACASARVLG